jgi:SAM-dependent methyltransferase
MESTNLRKNAASANGSAAESSWELFDGQASIFEQRAGLSEPCCASIAAAIKEIGNVHHDDLVVEIGPGTGQVGQHLAESSRYAGVDLSGGMLHEFQQRLVHVTERSLLIRANANRNWPLVNGSARVVFSSRAMHLLEHEHVAAEMFRVASPAGATLILGRVERTPDSTRTRMAREMIERLRRHGFQGRRGERQNRKLIDACCERGAEPLPLVQVASWKTSSSPRQSLDSWRCLTGLGGVPVPNQARDEILQELEDWAREVFGGLDQKFQSEEVYVLRSLRVPAGARSS